MDDSCAATPVAPPPVTVFLLEDHEIVRRGLVELVLASPGFTVVGEAGTVAQALVRIPALRPQVAVLDARLPDGSGIDVCREVRSTLPGTRCIMLTSYDDDDAVLAAIMAGASGYLLKEIRGRSLVDAIRRVADGQSLFDPAVIEPVLARLRHGGPEDARLASLTHREREIVGLIGAGMTSRQIEQELSLAEKSVKNYVSGLLAKLGMARRTQAAVPSGGSQH